jgi:Zinc-binding dehydrogenase
MREITNLIDAGLAHVPPIHVLLLQDAALAHQMIDSGHVRGKLVLKVAELYARSPRRRNPMTPTTSCTCGV